MKKMTRWGVGPKFGVLTFLYSVLIFNLSSTIFPNLVFTGLETTGLSIGCIGLYVFMYNALTIDEYFNNKMLRTSGLYKYVRHPIYASWIVIIIPGIVIWSGVYLALTIPIVAYFIFKSLIHIEDNYLLKMFGDEFLRYKERVNAVFPKLKKIKLR